MLPYLLIFLCFSIPYILSVFVGLRDMIGGFDVYIYAEIYEVSNDILLAFEPFELGFKLYYVALKKINADRHFMFLITAIICVFIHLYTLKKYVSLPFLAAFIYLAKFGLMNFVYLRQLMAVLVVWYATRFILNKKLLFFSLCIILASQFHTSAIIAFPIYFLNERKLSNSIIMIGLVSAIIMAITPLSQFLFGFLGDSLENEKLLHYSNIKTGFNYLYLIEIFIIIGLFFAYKSKFYQSKLGILAINGSVFYILLSAIALTNANFVRFTWYPFIFVIILISKIMYDFSGVQKRVVFKTVVFLYFGLLYFRYVFYLDEGDWIPYKAIYMDTERHGKFDFMEYRNKDRYQ